MIVANVLPTSIAYVVKLAVLLAAAKKDTDVTPGVLGFVVVALLGFATFLLVRSMNRQLKKIDLPKDPPDPS